MGAGKCAWLRYFTSIPGQINIAAVRGHRWVINFHVAGGTGIDFGSKFKTFLECPAKTIRRVARQKTVEKAAPATVNARLVALSRYFKWAAKQGLSRTNPTEDIPRSRPSNRRPKALKDTYAQRLLRQAHKSGNLRDAARLNGFCLRFTTRSNPHPQGSESGQNHAGLIHSPPSIASIASSASRVNILQHRFKQ